MRKGRRPEVKFNFQLCPIWCVPLLYARLGIILSVEQGTAEAKKKKIRTVFLFVELFRTAKLFVRWGLGPFFRTKDCVNYVCGS